MIISFLKALWRLIFGPKITTKYICNGPVNWITAEGDKYECWFHLYEDSNGNRTVEYIPSAQQYIPYKQTPISVGRRHRIYNRVLIPWMNYQYSNDDILVYFGYKSWEDDSATITKDGDEENKIIYPDFGKPKE